MCISRIKRHPFIGALAFSVLFVLLTFAVWGIVFDTVDDYNIMMSLSGDKTGEPYWQLTFYNVVLARFLAFLYRVFPFLQWYSLFQLAFICLAICIFTGAIIEKAVRYKWFNKPFMFGLLLIVICAFLYPVQRMQFTSTSALLGMASCTLVFSIDRDSVSRGCLTRRLSISGLLLLLSLLERQSTGLCCAVFWLSGYVRVFVLSRYGNLCEGQENIRKIVIFTLTGTIVVCIAVTAIHETVLRTGDNSRYSSYDEQRVEYQDHPHVTYDENPELYNKVGWSREVYELFGSLSFFAPEINEAALSELNKSGSTANESEIGLVQAFKNAAKIVRDDLGARALFTAALVPFVIIASNFATIQKSRDKYLLFAGSLFVVIGAILMAVILCLSGRWMLRLFQSICLPLLGSLSMLMFDFAGPRAKFGKHARTPKERPILCKTVGVATLSVLILGAIFSVSHIDNKAENDEKSLQQMHAIERFAISNPEDIFVHDYSVSNIWNSYDPFRVYGKNKPKNLIISGGSYTHTGCYQSQLKANGLNKLGPKEMVETVKYITDSDYPSFFERTLNYLVSVYGSVDAHVVSNLEGGVKVYDFC